MIPLCLRGADRLAEEGVSTEVVDVATLKPLDSATILDLVGRTGRCVIVHEAPPSYGPGAEIAALLASEGLLSLLAPVVRVSGFDVPTPLPKLEDVFLPALADILAACRAVMAYR
jgi:pyruvate dehydrogenase E1 component beta subunit